MKMEPKTLRVTFGGDAADGQDVVGLVSVGRNFDWGDPQLLRSIDIGTALPQPFAAGSPIGQVCVYELGEWNGRPIWDEVASFDEAFVESVEKTDYVAHRTGQGRSFKYRLRGMAS